MTAVATCNLKMSVRWCKSLFRTRRAFTPTHSYSHTPPTPTQTLSAHFSVPAKVSASLPEHGSPCAPCRAAIAYIRDGMKRRHSSTSSITGCVRFNMCIPLDSCRGFELGAWSALESAVTTLEYVDNDDDTRTLCLSPCLRCLRIPNGAGPGVMFFGVSKACRTSDCVIIGATGHRLAANLLLLSFFSVDLSSTVS